jgi:hypothetical protein
MKRSDQLEQLAQAVFARKRERRQQLAALPVEEKFEILLHLQQLASDVAKAAGRPAKQPWVIPRGLPK